MKKPTCTFWSSGLRPPYNVHVGVYSNLNETKKKINKQFLNETNTTVLTVIHFLTGKCILMRRKFSALTLSTVALLFSQF